MLPDRANMYSDSDGGGDTPPSGDTEDSGSESQTALLPKAVFGSEPKPGDTITLKAVSVHGDEVVCQKADGGEESPPDDGSMPPPDEGDARPQGGGIASMLAD
jgi:hypothetical protein